MKILILVAGYGTRLYPLTLNKAKSLLEIGGKTILDRIFEKISVIKACDKVYIISNHKFYPDFVDWARKSSYDKKIEVLDDGTLSDETRLGALGDIEFALDKGAINDDILIIFGDNIFDFGLLKLLDFIKSKNGLDAAIALYDVADLELAKKYGIVNLNNDNRIIGLEEKPQNPKSTLASAGLYYLPRKSIVLLRKYISLGLPKDPPGKFIAWLVSNYKVYGFAFKEKWFDVGDKESLRKADELYKKR